nr:MAG: hypothetical protein DIU68_13705 [Chloroflexota bacterium]
MAILCLSFALLLGSFMARAQDGNLLVNPGFEDPYVNQGGDPVRQVAEGWLPWHLPPPPDAPTYMNQQPEYLPARPDTARIRSGQNAQFITSFFATFNGGVYQVVEGVPAGAELTFSTYAYVWSSAFDNVDVSELDGDVVVQVGIDPTGGTNPSSAAIVWSPVTEQYDAWNRYAVTATAQGSTVTVFIRGVVGAPAKNNNIYLDDASLTVAGQQPPQEEPTATEVPPTEVPPTATFTEVPPTATATEVPPTETFTPVPPAETATEAPPTEVLPTETFTAIPPTQEMPPTATDTPVPSATFTATAVVTEGPTATPSNTPTATLQPTIDPTVFKSTITHIVQPGDTVQRLAILYGSTIDAILIANNLSPQALIYVGQPLIIPVRLPAPATLTPTPLGQQPPATATPLPPPPPTPVPVTVTYVVQVGDTLSRIAARFNTTVQAIAQLNGIVNPDRILLGQVLQIPLSNVVPPPAAPPTATPAPNVPLTYTVRPGDTLFRISIQFNVPIGQLIQLNGIVDPNRIFIGQVLRLQ